jgi:hypothetical protein
MAAVWKVNAVEVIERRPASSHAASANQMLLVAADMLLTKIQEHGVESADAGKAKKVTWWIIAATPLKP